MKQNIVDILKGKFLISDDAVKNWRFILFASLLAVVMIASSHNADQKVHDIARLNEQVQELRSEFVDTRSRLQRLKLESTIVTKLKDYGLQPSAEPSRKIRVTTK